MNTSTVPVTSSAVVPANNDVPSETHAIILLREEVTRIVHAGRKIPANLWNINPSVCMSIRDTFNAKQDAEYRELRRAGWNMKPAKFGKSGRTASFRLTKTQDGGARAEKQREQVRAAEAMAAMLAKVAALEAALAAANGNVANANATNV